MCAVQSAIGITPSTNPSSWEMLAIVGASGTGLSFYSTWSSSQSYSVEDSVPYGNKLYVCIKANTNQIPSISPDYWQSIISVPQQIILSQTQPENQNTGDIWMQTNSTDNSVKMFVKQSDGTYLQRYIENKADYVKCNDGQSVETKLSSVQTSVSAKADATTLSTHTSNATIHITSTERTTWNGKASTTSPTFTGAPKAPTAASGTNTTQIATTAFVQTALEPAYKVQIGDTITTLRADLDDDWLYCDGSAIYKTDYPELSEMLPLSISTITSKNTPVSTSIYDIAYGGGYWVAVGYNGAVIYATSAEGSFTLNTQGSAALRKVFYNGEYWVAVGNSGTVLYTTDPTGTWSVANTGAIGTVYSVYYGDGYWGIVAGSNVYYATSPNATWTANTISGAGTLATIAYGGGYWVVSNTSSSGALVYYTTDITGAWTASTTTKSSTARDCIYVNGTFLISVSGGRLYYTSNPSSTWTFWYLSDAYGVGYHDGVWCAVYSGSAEMCYATTLGGTWTSVNVTSTTNYYGVGGGENHLITCGADGKLQIIKIGYALPTISTGGNTYIKAK